MAYSFEDAIESIEHAIEHSEPHTTVTSHSAGPADPVYDDDSRPSWHDAQAGENADGDACNPCPNELADDDRWWINDGRWWTKTKLFDDDWGDFHTGSGRVHDDWHEQNDQLDDDDFFIDDDDDWGGDDMVILVGDDKSTDRRRRRLAGNVNGAPTRRPTMLPSSNTHPFFPMHGESHRVGSVRQ